MKSNGEGAALQNISNHLVLPHRQKSSPPFFKGGDRFCAQHKIRGGYNSKYNRAPIYQAEIECMLISKKNGATTETHHK